MDYPGRATRIGADAVEPGLRWRGAAAGLDLAAFTMARQDVVLRDAAGFNVGGGRTRNRGLECDFDWVRKGPLPFS